MQLQWLGGLFIKFFFFSITFSVKLTFYLKKLIKKLISFYKYISLVLSLDILCCSTDMFAHLIYISLYIHNISSV